MQAFLIDPFEETITEVEHNGNFREIYKFIDAQVFDIARIPYGDSIFVDDEGLYKSNQRFFLHTDYGQPLCGKALVLGTDDEGESTSPKITLEQLKERVQFGDPVNVMGRIIWIPSEKGEA